MQSPGDATLNAAFANRGQPTVTVRGGGANLLTNPGLESGAAAPWALSLDLTAGTVGVSTTTKRTGTYALALTRGAVGSANIFADTTAIAVTAGVAYRFVGYAKAADATKTRVCRQFVEFRDGADNVTGTAFRTFANNGDGWTRVEVTGTAPAGTVNAVLRVAAFAAGASEVHVWDDFVFQALTDVGSSAEVVSVRRELAGDLPSEVSLVTGAVSAAVDVSGDLRGVGPHPMATADRDGWPGAPLTVSSGYAGSPEVPIFGGVVRTIGFNEDASARRIVGMERSDLLRSPVTLKTYGSFGLRHKPRFVTRYPTNVSAVVVAALHASGIRVTPLDPQENTWSYVPLAFGLLADVGWTYPTGGSIPEGTTWLGAGKFAPAPINPSGIGVGAIALPAGPIPTNHTVCGFSFWVLVGSTGVIGGGSVRLDPVGASGSFVTVDFDGTNATVKFTDGAAATYATVTRPCAGSAGGTWHFVRVSMTSATTPTIRASVDNGAPASATTTSTFVAFTFRPRLVIVAGGVQAAHGWSGTNTTELSDVLTAAAEADVDTATLEVDLLPAVDGRIAWDLLKEVAAAELGMVGFDETGRFYFKSRATIRANVTPVATWGTDLVDNLAGSASIETVRDRAVCSSTRSWLIDSGTGASTAATTAVASYLHDEPITVPTGTSDVYIDLPAPVTIGTMIVNTTITTPGGPYSAEVWMVLCSTADGTGARYTGTAVTATIHMIAPTRLRLRIVNGSGGTLYATWPSTWSAAAPTNANSAYGLETGQAGFGINGRSLTNAKTTVTSTIVRGEGDRTFELAASPWRTGARVRILLDAVLADLSRPRLQLEDVRVPADLRWQIGDVVRLTDWRGRLPDVDARIVRLAYDVTREAENGMVATVSLRALPS